MNIKNRNIVIIATTIGISVVAIIAFIIYHHSHNYRHELTEIDSLCETNPEKAIRMLSHVSQDTLVSETNSMYYKLLKIKADNNLYKQQKDSTIFQIVDFFEHYGDKEKLSQGYYYQGKYFIQHNDAPQGLICFQKVTNLWDKNTSLTFKSKVYNQIGNIFLGQNLYDQALTMFNKSFQCDSILRDTVKIIHSMRDMAQTFRHLGRNDNSMILLNKAYILSNKKNNIFLKKTIALSLIALYLSENKIDKAYKIYSNNLVEVEKSIQSPTYSSAIIIYNELGKLDSVYKYCNKLLSVGNPDGKQFALENLLDYYSTKGDLHKVRITLKKYKELSDTVRVKNTAETILKINSLYNYNMIEKENTTLKMEAKEKVYTFVVITMALLLLCFMMFYQREKSKKKYIKTKFMHEHLEQLYKTACCQYESNLHLKEKEIANLMEKIEFMNGNTTEEIDKMHIYEILREKIKSNKKLSEKNWEEIFILIDKVYVGLKSKLQGAHGLNDEEYKISILVKLDLLNMEIATLVCKTPSAITQKRAAIYKKIFKEKGTSKEFDAYIKSL